MEQTMTAAQALGEILERITKIEETQARTEEKLDEIIEFVNQAGSQIEAIAEKGIGGLLSGGLGSLFGGS